MVNIIKKANKRLHFIVQFKRAKAPEQDIIIFYVTCVGPTYLSDTIEWVQKRVLAIIYPDSDYADSLDLCGILKLNNRRLKVCDILFNDIVTAVSYNLGHLPERHTQDIILDRLESLSPKSKGLRTPLSCLQLEFIKNPDI